MENLTDIILLGGNRAIAITKCEKCSKKMVNLDADELKLGDLKTLKQASLRISNPETEAHICLNCEVDTWGKRLASWFESDDDDDDSSFFGGGSSTPSSGGGLFGGGGFGGFGGGTFSGGGASSSW